MTDALEESSSQQQVTSNDLLRLANEAKLQRLQHEALQLRERKLDQNTSAREQKQIDQRAIGILNEGIEASKEIGRLGN